VLLGDNTDGGAVVLSLIALRCVGSLEGGAVVLSLIALRCVGSLELYWTGLCKHT